VYWKTMARAGSFLGVTVTWFMIDSSWLMVDSSCFKCDASATIIRRVLRKYFLGFGVHVDERRGRLAERRVLGCHERHHLIESLWFRVQGVGFRIQGSGCRLQGSGFRVQGPGCRVHGLGLRVDGVGL
jgi:hypothetical protein